MSKKKSTSNLISKPSPRKLTPKQKRVAVKAGELPPCFGTGKVKCCHPPSPTMLKGYDDKYRCLVCNAIHIEEVMEEAGNDSDPNTPPKFVSVRQSAAAVSFEVERKKAIFEKCKPRGGWSIPPQVGASPGDIVDMKGRRFGSNGEISEPKAIAAHPGAERRAAILKKYRK